MQTNAMIDDRYKRKEVCFVTFLLSLVWLSPVETYFMKDRSKTRPFSSNPIFPPSFHEILGELTCHQHVRLSANRQEPDTQASQSEAWYINESLLHPRTLVATKINVTLVLQ
jgi:hypothetical protein